MTKSIGFDHVATITADLDRIVAFYQQVFDVDVTLEIPASDTHRRMVILDFGGGAALNVVEQPAETIVGDRRRSGARGPIDHFGIAVADSDELRATRERLIAAAADVGVIQRLGDTWSLFFRDPDGMELEVCTPVREGPVTQRTLPLDELVH
jgi:catechol 2,3-dioxygenase-like lactoylglutathione lyase family enzyme